VAASLSRDRVKLNDAIVPLVSPRRPLHGARCLATLGGLTLALAGYGGRAEAQVVTGRVLRRDGTPIADASIFAGDSTGETGRAFRASANGHFRFKLDAAGTFFLRVRRLGYRQLLSPALTVGPADSLSYDAYLDEVPQQLATVTVDAEIESIRDLQVLGFGIRSMPATIIGPSQIEAVGRDARTYVDILRKIHLISVNIDETCVRDWKGLCLALYLNDRLLADDEELLKATRFVIDPNDIDHILYVRADDAAPSGVAGSLFVYTRTYTERQRRLLRKRLPP
jgi:hypothetical protein